MFAECLMLCTFIGGCLGLGIGLHRCRQKPSVDPVEYAILGALASFGGIMLGALLGVLVVNFPVIFLLLIAGLIAIFAGMVIAAAS